jgi:hypothetical protein
MGGEKGEKIRRLDNCNFLREIYIVLLLSFEHFSQYYGDDYATEWTTSKHQYKPNSR